MNPDKCYYPLVVYYKTYNLVNNRLDLSAESGLYGFALGLN